MKAMRWLIVCGILLAAALPALAQGRLNAVREDIRRDDDNERSSDRDDCYTPSSSPRHHGHRDHDDDFALGTLFVLMLWGDKTYPMSFPSYPYPLGLPGYMQDEPFSISHVTGQTGEELFLKWWGVRLSLENGHNFDGLNRFNGTMLTESQIGVGLYTSWNWFHERLPGGGTDDATLGNITLTWRNIECEYFQTRWGLGAWIFADGRADAGINAHFSADIYPMRPVVVSLLAEGGTLGDTSIGHLRGTVGYLYKGLEIFGGYDVIRIGSTNLHGPLIGARLWF